MKVFTKNLGLFTAIALGFTILFRFALSYSIDHSWGWIIALVSVIYFLLMYAIGHYFGKRDHIENQIFDIGFRFHTVTYIVCNGLGLLWFVLDLNSKGESLATIKYTALYWGLLLIVHFVIFLLTRKYAIKGYEKSDIFE